MKIVVLDGYTENPGDLSWAPLEAIGDLAVYDRTPFDEAEIISRSREADIIVTNKTPLSAATISACGKLKLIAVLATGYNVVDLAAARTRGIPVSNVPGYGTDAVAQNAIALLLSICFRPEYHDRQVHGGRWSKCKDFCFWDYPIIELRGKTMGIIGFGRIGRAVGRIAKAIGMNIIAYNRSQCDEGREIGEYVSLDELLSRSDVISLHCSLSPDVAGIINAANIAKMKDGVIIINNSRGGLVVDADLAGALNSGKVYAAGLDVISEEPISSNNPLLTAKNCIITPHISWAAKGCRERIMNTTAENINAFLSGSPINVVN